MLTCRLCLRDAISGQRLISRASSSFAGSDGSGGAFGTIVTDLTFEDLGLPPRLVKALRTNFPHVVTPTQSQAALLQALIPKGQQGHPTRDSLRKGKGKERARNFPSTDPGNGQRRSLILRDVTGSGKSLALLLSLLSTNKVSEPSKRPMNPKKKVRPKIEQLLLVPHSELARQYEHWLELLEAYDGSGGDLASDEASQRLSPVHNEQADPHPNDAVEDDSTSTLPLPIPTSTTTITTANSSPTQVIYRGTDGKASLRPSTRTLIATPSALIDVLPRLELSRLHTIALDEADSMLDLPARFANFKEVKKWERHPPLLMSIMEELLDLPTQAQRSVNVRAPPTTTATATTTNTHQQKPRQAEGLPANTKTIVAVSATANSVFRDWLVRRSGWINSRGVLGEKQIDWYDFSLAAASSELGGSAQGDVAPSSESHGQSPPSVHQRIGRSLMPQDSIEHRIYRIDGTGDILPLKDDGQQQDGGAEGGAEGASRGRGKLAVKAEPVAGGRQPQATESTTALPELERFALAIAQVFAQERVISGLVLIPSGQSLVKTLAAYHGLGVPATTLSEGMDLPPDEPRLYVVSRDAVRGLDVPGLSHVFLTPGTVDESANYLHIAGRVGRLSAADGGRRRKGRVICLARVENEESDRARVERCWELLGIDGKVGAPTPV